MTSVQYNLKYQNNQIANEEGAFFKAIPFSIKIDQLTYDVLFKKGLKDVVVYQICVDDHVFLELNHPDYIPSCSVEDLSNYLDSAHAETLFYALAYLDISIDKDFKSYLFAEGRDVLDFQITQASYF
tara:strand:- start:4936 stop:5316 length:381 start_codon:yes stop_codon:yes gene_type:complete